MGERRSLGSGAIYRVAGIAWGEAWPWARAPERALLEAVGDPTLAEVVGSHLDQHLVAGQHADAVLAHLARGVGDDLVFVFQFHPEGGVRRQLADRAGEFQKLFFRHAASRLGQKQHGPRDPSRASRSACVKIITHWATLGRWASVPYPGDRQAQDCQ